MGQWANACSTYVNFIIDFSLTNEIVPANALRQQVSLAPEMPVEQSNHCFLIILLELSDDLSSVSVPARVLELLHQPIAQLLELQSTQVRRFGQSNAVPPVQGSFPGIESFRHALASLVEQGSFLVILFGQQIVGVKLAHILIVECTLK